MRLELVADSTRYPQIGKVTPTIGLWQFQLP